MVFDLAGKRIWVAGHGGMVGRALVDRLAREPCEVLTIARADLDLTRQSAVEAYIAQTRPDAIVLAAARVGGILANRDAPVDFLLENLQIATNVIAGAHANDVERLLVLGSSCIYPALAPQPIREAALLTGALEASNEGYAVAKIAGIKLAQAYRRQYGRDYISAMPCNLYGPFDNFDPGSSHVLPALIRKAHVAKRSGAAAMTIWGSGLPQREFLHVEDCADALVLVLKSFSEDTHINLGSGSELSILALAQLVCDIVGFKGEIALDRTRPNGVPRKLMCSARLRALGWAPRIDLEQGIAKTYDWFLAHVAQEGGG